MSNSKLIFFKGGTFTVSNLGMFGIKHFAAVINPPQVNFFFRSFKFLCKLIVIKVQLFNSIFVFNLNSIRFINQIK